MRIKSRYPEVITYHAKSDWDGKTGGISTVTEGRTIVYDTPTTYGGEGNGICPDELFVTAVLGCLNNTFLDFQRRFELELVSLHLEGTATAKFDDEGYQITQVDVSGEIVVGEDEIETGERCVVLMKKFCHLTRTIKDCIPIRYNIIVREK